MWQILKRHQSLAYKFLTHALIYQLSAKCRRIMILLDTITKTVKVVCLVCFSKQPEILKSSIAHLFPALRAFWFLEKTALHKNHVIPFSILLEMAMSCSQCTQYGLISNLAKSH
jgi:hypothetical protein